MVHGSYIASDFLKKKMTLLSKVCVIDKKTILLTLFVYLLKVGILQLCK